MKLSINQPNWTNTGVINDLPPENGSPASSNRKAASRRTSVKGELARKEIALDERDRARAAEYALKEVLGSVKAAKYVSRRSLDPE